MIKMVVMGLSLPQRFVSETSLQSYNPEQRRALVSKRSTHDYQLKHYLVYVPVQAMSQRKLVVWKVDRSKVKNCAPKL